MEKTVVTIGTFDGVHVGHQAVLRQTAELGQALRSPTIAYSFAFPPRCVIARKGKRCLLLPDWAKRELLLKYVDQVRQTDFAHVQNLLPEQFLRHVLSDQLRCRALVVGERFRFGRSRAGSIGLLRRFGKAKGGNPKGLV